MAGDTQDRDVARYGDRESEVKGSVAREPAGGQELALFVPPSAQAEDVGGARVGAVVVVARGRDDGHLALEGHRAAETPRRREVPGSDLVLEDPRPLTVEVAEAPIEDRLSDFRPGRVAEERISYEEDRVSEVGVSRNGDRCSEASHLGWVAVSGEQIPLARPTRGVAMKNADGPPAASAGVSGVADRCEVTLQGDGGAEFRRAAGVGERRLQDPAAGFAAVDRCRSIPARNEPVPRDRYRTALESRNRLVGNLLLERLEPQGLGSGEGRDGERRQRDDAEDSPSDGAHAGLLSVSVFEREPRVCRGERLSSDLGYLHPGFR